MAVNKINPFLKLYLFIDLFFNGKKSGKYRGKHQLKGITLCGPPNVHLNGMNLNFKGLVLSIMGLDLCQELTKICAMLINKTNYKIDYGWTIFIEER